MTIGDPNVDTAVSLTNDPTYDEHLFHSLENDSSVVDNLSGCDVEYLVYIEDQSTLLSFVPSYDLEWLEEFYSLKNSKDIQQFLSCSFNPLLKTILIQVPEKVAHFFPNADLSLSLVGDPDFKGDKLLLEITPDLEYTPNPLKKLDLFDYQWWLEASDDVSTELAITLEYR